MIPREYPPLFAEGFRDIGIWQLDEIFLKPFGEDSPRRELIDRFRSYLRLFEPLPIPIEIWIDGSFATYKPEPADIDIVIVVSNPDLDNFTIIQFALFDELTASNSSMKNRYGCDFYIIDGYDEGQIQKWKHIFGTDRSNVNSKGIYRIKLNTKV